MVLEGLGALWTVVPSTTLLIVIPGLIYDALAFHFYRLK